MKNFFFFLLFFVALPATSLYAQQSTGTITGKIRDRQTKLEPSVRAKLVELSTKSILQTLKPEADGTFTFHDVPFAQYDVEIALDTILLARKRVTVRSTIPVSITIDSLREYELSAVIIEAERTSLETRTSAHTLYTARTIKNLPSPSGAKKIEAVLLNTPGVVPDEDGRLHVRGEDAMLQYVIDGIPVTDNLTRIYSSLFNADLIKSVDVETGSLNAEYGVAASGVLALSTKSGFDRPLFGNASVLFGNFGTKEQALELGGNVGNRAALFVAANHSESDRYLDPISGFQPIHGAGTSRNYFGKFDALLSNDIDLNVIGSYNTTQFSIPNSSDTSRQDQIQDVANHLLGARLNINVSPSSVVSLLGYTRFNQSHTTSGGLSRISSPGDSAKAVRENEKFFIGADRRMHTSGGQVEFSSQPEWFGLINNIKVGAGGEVYPIREYFTFAVTNPGISDSSESGGDIRYRPYDITQGGKPFLVDQSKDGSRYSAYIQDQFRSGQWTINAGLRYDAFTLFETETALSPRLALAYAMNDDLLLRASYNRIVMQAPLENILVSSSSEAARLTRQDTMSTPLHVMSEREHVLEIGGAYRLNNFLDLDLAGFGKFIDNFIVKVELGNSGIIFPVNLKQGLVAGGEFTARLHDWNNFSGLLSISSCASLGVKPNDGSSPIAAGLILGEEGKNYSHPFAGEDMFPTEHNQLITASMNITYHLTTGLTASLGGRFDSGLPFDLTDKNGNGLDEEQSRAELRRRGYTDDVINLLYLIPEKPGSPDKSVAAHITFDIAAGYDFITVSMPLRVTATIMNIFDTPYLYKFESSFGGTHFGQPRTFAVQASLYY